MVVVVVTARCGLDGTPSRRWGCVERCAQDARVAGGGRTGCETMDGGKVDRKVDYTNGLIVSNKVTFFLCKAGCFV